MPTKIMGILAGMGPRSTAPFIDRVVSECQRQYGARDDIDFPPMLIYTLPAPFYVDRPLDHAALESTICAGLQHLERTGVALIAMPCNTAHIYYAQFTRCIQTPLLNMIEIALRHVPPSARRVALIATRPTVEANLYQAALQSLGLALISREQWQQNIDTLIRAIKIGQSPLNAQALWQALMHEYEAAAIDTVLIACTDINVVSSTYQGQITLLDATQCLAAALVSEWRALSLS